MKRGSETSPLSAWQRVFSCLFAPRGRSSRPRATRVDKHDRKPCEISLHQCHHGKKLCTFLAHADEIDSNSEQQRCGRRVAGWQCNVLGWRLSRQKKKILLHSQLSVSEHSAVWASRRMQISSEDTHKAGRRKCGSKRNNGVKSATRSRCAWLNKCEERQCWG